ncbi:MAG TPA: cytochrome c peroxidase [Kofleriaceae bacterium]|jgi:cytochrome c peroxidase
MRLAIALGIAATLAGCKQSEPEPARRSATPAPLPPLPRASQLPLPPLPALELPPDPKREAKVELGRALFFEQRLAATGDRSCASCHANHTDNAPALWNVAYFKDGFYRDGRAPTLEATAKAEAGGGDNLDTKAAELAKLPAYRKLFEAAGYGDVKADQLAEALADYERTLICNDTRYDKLAAGDKTAMTEQEQRGLDVFAGKGRCSICHAPPFFSSAMGVDKEMFFNIGIGTAGVADAQVDAGRMKVSNQPTDWAAFKPPSLRDITRTAPYFHDGSVGKLDDAVKLMATGGIANRNKTALLLDAELTDAERADLVAFLGTLDCP